MKQTHSKIMRFFGFSVQSLMDRVKVTSKEGKGTTVTLERDIRSKEA